MQIASFKQLTVAELRKVLDDLPPDAAVNLHDPHRDPPFDKIEIWRSDDGQMWLRGVFADFVVAAVPVRNTPQWEA